MTISRLHPFLSRYGKLLGIAAALAIATIGLFTLHRLLLQVNLTEIRAAFDMLSIGQIVAALVFTCASYLALTFYDVLALDRIGRRLPWRTAALASFTSYTLSHNLGLALLTGGSARYRIYSAAGLGAGDIARIIANAGITFWLGVFTLAAIALVIHPGDLIVMGTDIDPLVQRLAGGAVLAGLVVAGFLLRKAPSIHLLGWTLPLPGARHALLQIGIAAIDLATASAALFVLVPHVSPAAYPAFFLGYALALILALISHVPGGIGVFEAVMLAALPGVDRPTLFAALIAYRVIYYLLPLLAGALLLAAQEGRQWRRPMARTLAAAQMVAAGIAPLLLAALTFTGGLVLLVSGSLPAEPGRLDALYAVLPLPFIEASHIAASLAGTGLLLLAPGLLRRLDGAFVATRALLLAGAAFSLAKGLDYEEAVVLLTITAALQWTRPAFYRHTALTARVLTPGWIAAMLLAIGLSLWIGFFSYKHIAYRDELWWHFALRGDASRFLRASLAAAVMLIGAILWHMLRPAHPRTDRNPAEGETIARALALTSRTDAMLALAGDKLFLTAPSGDAFLMYQVQGRSWIVMGDPVGSRAEWPDLLWRLRERADRAQGRLLLYQIGADTLPMAIDLGLQLIKYGEEARVDLQHFSLEGPRARSLRHAVRRAEREGARFALVPRDQVPAILAELRAVSEDWLSAKGQSEKAFSLGRFDPAYIRQFDMAVVRVDRRIVAFANIWATTDRQEISVDLMRHRADVPYGTMDYLFASLMDQARIQGYGWFNLGLAPLSGLKAGPMAPLWSQAGAFLSRHAETLYGFEGLRTYKDKFAPLWTPRYIAGPNGLGMARAMIDLQTLVGGGWASAVPIRRGARKTASFSRAGDAGAMLRTSMSGSTDPREP